MSEKKASVHKDSRRNFLRKSLVAAAGLYIVPRHVLGGKGYTAPSDKLTIASVGAGGKGEVDINYLSGTGMTDIAFLCDVDDRRASAIRTKFTPPCWKKRRSSMARTALTITGGISLYFTT